uniref:Uncharacterized protein n=1 Tax=Salmonella sp. TaxID=599 RepID=A0A482EUD1_SALSP|nr:hypothetical protein [Salmonella sp.]QBM91434.1 hypothetical protein NNIBIDOC_00104 [Salmonella sp.]
MLNNDWLDVSGLREHPDAVAVPPLHRSSRRDYDNALLHLQWKIFSDAQRVLLNKSLPNKGDTGRGPGIVLVSGPLSIWLKTGVYGGIMQEEHGCRKEPRKPETLMRYLRRGGVWG